MQPDISGYFVFPPWSDGDHRVNIRLRPILAQQRRIYVVGIDLYFVVRERGEGREYGMEVGLTTPALRLSIQQKLREISRHLYFGTIVRCFSLLQGGMGREIEGSCVIQRHVGLHFSPFRRHVLQAYPVAAGQFFQPERNAIYRIFPTLIPERGTANRYSGGRKGYRKMQVIGQFDGR